MEKSTKLALMLLLLSAPIHSENLWTISYDIGIPELTGLRYTNHHEPGIYWGFQPGVFVALPAYYWNVDARQLTLSPAVYVGKDLATNGIYSFSMELHLGYPTYLNKYSDGGGLLFSPRFGLSVKKNRLLFRCYGGVSSVIYTTTPGMFGNSMIPSILLEFGIIPGKKRWNVLDISGRRRNHQTAPFSGPDVPANKNAERQIDDENNRYVYHDKYTDAITRENVVTTDPFIGIIRRNIGITYSYGMSKRVAAGINAQLAFSDYATKFGATAGVDFYFRKVFYGWHIPLLIGLIPAKITVSDVAGREETVSDLVYAFAMGTGIGYQWCFKNGFTLNPMAGISYISLKTMPTDAFIDRLSRDFSETYDNVKSEFPPIMYGAGISVGWAF